MIPKIIHYCWFGGNPLPKSAQKCIKSWKKFFPDYEIMEWNENSFDIHCCKFVEQAYEQKKWAFVADYARMFALFCYGGLYFDTDVEVIRDFENITNCRAFFSLTPNCMNTHTLGAEKGLSIFHTVMMQYQEHSFISEDGTCIAETINSILFKLLCKEYDLSYKSEVQCFDDGTVFYPSNYFDSTDWQTGIVSKSPELRVIHYADATWMPEKERKNIMLRRKCIALFGEKLGTMLSIGVIYIKNNGLISLIKKLPNLVKSRKN